MWAKYTDRPDRSRSPHRRVDLTLLPRVRGLKATRRDVGDVLIIR
jgi:hypothetical protein